MKQFYVFQSSSFRSCLFQSRNYASTSKRNFYEVLGLKQDASQNDIKKAFYTLSKKYHPDIVGPSDKNAADKFLEIKNAYDTLRDQNQRKIYDQQTKISSFNSREFGNSEFNKDFSYYYKHARKTPRESNNYTNDDFFRIWETMQKSKEFHQTNNDFNEMLRKAHERLEKEQNKRRQERWQKFTDENFSKNPSRNPFRRENFMNSSYKTNFSAVNKIIMTYFLLFVGSLIYQHMRNKQKFYYENESNYDKSQRDRIYDLINRPTTRY